MYYRTQIESINKNTDPNKLLFSFFLMLKIFINLLIYFAFYLLDKRQKFS